MALSCDSPADLQDWGEQTFLDGITLMTVAFWVQPTFTNWGTGRHLVGNTSAIAADGFSVGRGFSGTQLMFNVGTAAQFEPNISDTLWTHVHMVWDGNEDNDDRMKVWYNGVLQTPIGIPAWVGTTILTHSANLLVGSIHGVLVDANIAELNIWADAAITGPASRTTIMNGCGNLIAPSNLELDVGMLIQDDPVDRSQNELSRILTGTWFVATHPPGVQDRSTCGVSGTDLIPILD